MSNLIKSLIFKIRFYFAKEQMAIDPRSPNGDNAVVILYKIVGGNAYITHTRMHTKKELERYV